MKIPIVDLNLVNVKELKAQNEWSDHFKLVVWPRILFWLGLKELFVDHKQLDWKIHFTPDNMHNNFISMHIVDEKEVFNFYFQVPLVERLSFNLYLGDNTYNFFEIHPALIAKGVIKKEEIEIGATSNILPHLVLSTSNSKYDKRILWDIDEDNYCKLVKYDPIINLLNANFIRFIPPLKKIIDNEWKL
ncbi:hypothetical protein [Saccharicrinis fermentans]|uniref:Uncharacterized protein n=1 Tax=Saccharicrinis fermentans DSM 9555 = JCM 21142 TaxID=869213 RepID=W7Y4I0_9BACT|nr:hypothetical protein [Saccharicrinis fermentans]GAF02493.1 hypothetical protein JCM21142_31131 [Saccharicrinis fermentans DSM 9555 = JCM 21142]